MCRSLATCSALGRLELRGAECRDLTYQEFIDIVSMGTICTPEKKNLFMGHHLSCNSNSERASVLCALLTLSLCRRRIGGCVQKADL